MTITHCDICDKLRPCHTSDEGAFCYPCKGDFFDPYCEIDDAIEAVESKLAALIRTAETAFHWLAIDLLQAQELAPLLALRMEAARYEGPEREPEPCDAATWRADHVRDHRKNYC